MQAYKNALKEDISYTPEGLFVLEMDTCLFVKAVELHMKTYTTTTKIKT